MQMLVANEIQEKFKIITYVVFRVVDYINLDKMIFVKSLSWIFYIFYILFFMIHFAYICLRKSTLPYLSLEKCLNRHAVIVWSEYNSAKARSK